jgi:hypothetical protein
MSVCRHSGKEIARYNIGAHLLIEYQCERCDEFYTEQFDSAEQTDTPQKPSKMGNQRVTHDGIEFASIVEGRRYLQLKALQTAGLIKDLKPHPPFTLYPGGTDNEGKKINAVDYVADFSYFDLSIGKTVIEDVKGHATAAFKIKWKLMRDKFKNDPTVKLVELPARNV